MSDEVVGVKLEKHINEITASRVPGHVNVVIYPQTTDAHPEPQYPEVGDVVTVRTLKSGKVVEKLVELTARLEHSASSNTYRAKFVE